IDLLVHRNGGARIEVVDYKSASVFASDKSGQGGAREVDRYALQLRAYAAAVALGARPDAEVVAGVVFLGSGDGLPVWLEGGANLTSGGEASALVHRIDDVARALLSARASGAFPAVERSRCDAIRCGFVPLCHPSRPADREEA